MFRKHYTVKINLPGGIIAGGDLHAIIEAAEAARVADIRFGTRQQLFCRVADKYGPEFLQTLDRAGIFYESNEERHPNIVSSYVTEDVFHQANWVSEGMYKDILDGFDFRPRLKINLIEANQSFVPFFTGNLNFISSPTGNYWYLYVRLPGSGDLYLWKGLIYSRDIPRVSRLIEETTLRSPTGSSPIGTSSIDRALTDLSTIGTSPIGRSPTSTSLASPSPSGDLFSDLQARANLVTQPVTEDLALPVFSLPYYEGFNRYGSRLWLGIYRREELFPLAFLKDICLICQQTKIGQLYTTPWKSLIVKGIDPSDRQLWDYVLGKYRINVRHASNELNWHVEDMCEEGLRLKRYLVRQFDNDDIRTYGLCFTIKTRPGSGLFGSVVIRRQETPGHKQRAEKYDLLYTRDFNANSKDYVLFRESLEKENLGTYLVSLCKYFYELQSESDLISHAAYRANKETAEEGPAKRLIHQCRHCLSVYDEEHGEPERGVPQGRAFADLENDYTCAVCGATREDFVAVEKPGLFSGERRTFGTG